jgi:hypothetical protein
MVILAIKLEMNVVNFNFDLWYTPTAPRPAMLTTHTRHAGLSGAEGVSGHVHGPGACRMGRAPAHGRRHTGMGHHRFDGWLRDVPFREDGLLAPPPPPWSGGAASARNRRSEVTRARATGTSSSVLQW